MEEHTVWTEFYKACTMLLGWSPCIKGVGSLLNLDAILGKGVSKGVGRGFPVYGPVTLASEYFVAQHY